MRQGLRSDRPTGGQSAAGSWCRGPSLPIGPFFLHAAAELFGPRALTMILMRANLLSRRPQTVIDPQDGLAVGEQMRPGDEGVISLPMIGVR